MGQWANVSSGEGSASATLFLKPARRKTTIRPNRVGWGAPGALLGLRTQKHMPMIRDGSQRMKRHLATWLWATMITAMPITAYGELYTFVDETGVVHFTNVPSDPRHAPHRVEQTSNTFTWTDGLGSMRRVHRVDVTTYDGFIREAAAYYSLPAALVKAVIAAESAFEPTVVSRAGAQGLMQLLPKTAASMHVREVFDPEDNIFGGTRYLRLMANHFDGDLRLTAAAYNAGPKAVEKAKGVPPFEETRVYVRRVLKLYEHYLQHWSDGRPATPERPPGGSRKPPRQ